MIQYNYFDIAFLCKVFYYMYDFSYRFKPIGIDGHNGYAGPDKEEIKKRNSKLTSFNSLDEKFNKLEQAYTYATNKREHIIINVNPTISGIYELAVYHKIKRKLFSRTIKINCYSICVSKNIGENKICSLAYQTDDINKVKRIFNDFIEKQTAPDLTNWEIIFTDGE